MANGLKTKKLKNAVNLHCRSF